MMNFDDLTVDEVNQFMTDWFEADLTNEILDTLQNSPPILMTEEGMKPIWDAYNRVYYRWFPVHTLEIEPETIDDRQKRIRRIKMTMGDVTHLITIGPYAT